MRTKKHLMLLLGAAGLALALTRCGGTPVTTITVGNQQLTLMETSYGKADYYCDQLANGEYMVILSDFGACAKSKSDGGVRQVFHSSTNTNLRFIFPSFLTKVPATNTFMVGKSDCKTITAVGTQAIAYFSHQTDAQATYDSSVQADSGTITVQYQDPKSSVLTGTYDLTFGSDHITGNFTAGFCAGIVPGVAD